MARACTHIRDRESETQDDANPLLYVHADTSSAQSPAPGPVADTPSTPASTPATPEAPAPPTADPTATAPVSQGQTRPMVLPSSARRTTNAHVAAAPALALLLAVAAALV